MIALRAGLVEETLFRWFPLGFLAGFVPQIPINFLVVSSACLFALIHLLNFSMSQISIGFVLPQFFMGLVLSYAFLRWGFTGAAFIHFVYDLALLSIVRNMIQATKYAKLLEETKDAA